MSTTKAQVARRLLWGLMPLAVLLVSARVAAAAPLPPDADPFYRAPASLASYRPGAIIRTRRVEVLLGPAPLSLLGATSYQLLYRTNDGAGHPAANATTVIVPTGPALPGGRPLVSLQDAEDSLTTNCAPSYQLQIGERDNADLQAELPAAGPSQLAAGRVLVIPDPYGPQSEFLVTRMEADATLDSIRAAERFAPAQLAGAHTRVALVGYSGGGHETSAAAELQPVYAPELHVVGVAAGGTPAGDRETFTYVDGRTGAGVVMGAMLALERAHPRLGWSSRLNAYGRSVARRETSGPGCVNPVVSGSDHVRDWTTVADPLGVPSIAHAIAANTLGRTAPAAPTLLYVSQHDELISLDDSDRLARRYCAHGARLDYVRDPIDYAGPLGDHLEAALAGFIPRALSYLDARFLGLPAAQSCPRAGRSRGAPCVTKASGRSSLIAKRNRRTNPLCGPGRVAGKTIVERGRRMSVTFPGESAAYRAARDRLLEREIDLRRATEAVAELRRALPPGGVVPQDYVFEGATADGAATAVRLSELFASGRDSLVIYSFMFPRDPGDDSPGPVTGQTALLPLAEGPCPSCTALLDQLDGAAEHATQHINFAVVAKAPLARVLTFGRERGWRHLQLLSSATSTYNRDYLAETAEGWQRPMLNVFHRDGDTIRHFWGSELFYAPTDPGEDPRHVGTLEPLWNMFDLTPEGRPAGWYERLNY